MSQNEERKVTISAAALETAQAYFPSTVWSTLSDDQKERAALPIQRSIDDELMRRELLFVHPTMPKRRQFSVNGITDKIMYAIHCCPSQSLVRPEIEAVVRKAFVDELERVSIPLLHAIDEHDKWHHDHDNHESYVDSELYALTRKVLENYEAELSAAKHSNDGD